MRYLRKFSGDQITLDDFLPSSHDIQVDIPEIKKSGPSRLDDLPIRVKTRYNGKKGNSTRRVVSTPIFDLVTMDTLSNIIPPPKLKDEIPTRPVSTQSTPINFPKSRPIPRQRKAPSGLEKNLPSVPQDLMQKFHQHQNHQQQQQQQQQFPQQFPQRSQKRQVSMPARLLNSHDKTLHQIHDYTNIIQIYEENSPFGVFGSEQTTLSSPSNDLSTSPKSAEISSPEVNSASSLSDSASNSSDYSFVNSSEDDVISLEPAISGMNINDESNSIEKMPVSRTKLHPRDSIRYMRNYGDYHDQFEIKTKTPPVLPQHIENVVEKDAYYKSRASFDGERNDPSVPTSPCNERDTAIFTRRSRRIQPKPPSKVNANIEPTRNISPNENVQQIQNFQMPGYRGGLRVVNRAAS